MKRSIILIAIAILAIGGAYAQTTTKKFTKGDFTSIKAEYAYNVNITKGSSNIIELICPERIVEYLEVSVSNNTLYLSADMPKGFWGNKVSLKGDEEIIVNVEMEEIENISLSGASSVRAWGKFKTNNFKLTMSGASEIEDALNIEADKFTYSLSGASEAIVCGVFQNISGHISGASEFELNADATNLTAGCSGASEMEYSGRVSEKIAIECTGASEVNMTGNCSEISIECSGASEVDAEEMISQNAQAYATGASFIKVYADGKLNLKASGGSKIRYYGKGEYIPDETSSNPIARGK